MRRFFKQYGLISLLLFSCFLLSWQLINRFYTQQVTTQQVTYLQKKGAFLLRLSQGEPAHLKTMAASYIADSNERMTILDTNGAILYDSFDSTLTGKRNNRPEVRAVMDGNPIGQATRHSVTLNKQLLYVALPIKKANHLIGYLRVAEPTAEFIQAANGMKQSIFLIYLLFYILGYLVVLHLLKKRNRPIQTVLPILKRMTKEPAANERIIYEKTTPESAELIAILNKLNDQMQQTQLAYTTSEKQLATLLNELTIGIFILDRDGTIKTMNTVMQHHLGITQPLVSNCPFTSVITDTQFIQLIYHVNEDHPFVHEELTLTSTNKVMDITLRYFKENHQILATAYDLTRIRRLEKVQRDFVGNVTHELKTPVTSLIGFTETLLDGAKEDPATLTHFLTIMQKDAYRLDALIHQVIQLSKMEDDYAYEEKNVPLAPFIQHIVDAYQPLLTSKQINLLISGPEQFLFFTKQELLYSILKNLIENAIHYSPSQTTIQINFSIQEETLQLTIKDQGIGIAQEDQTRIFERFYRVDKARTRHSGGSGLGLAIVKEYVEALNGTLSLESYPGVGTTFVLQFPCS